MEGDGEKVRPPLTKSYLNTSLDTLLTLYLNLGKNMEKIVPISDLQTKTKEIVEGVKKTGDPVVITQRGRPAVLVVNYQEYEGMIHTLDEMSYPDWAERLKESEEDSKKGKGISLAKVKKKVMARRKMS